MDKKEKIKITKAKKTTKKDETKLEIFLASSQEAPKGDVLDQILESNDKFFYLDKANSTKDLQRLLKLIEDANKTAKLNKVSFGLDENDFIYELHVI